MYYMVNKPLNDSRSTTMTVRISPETSDRLEALARDTKRSKTYLAGEAITNFVEQNAWQIAHIKAALEEAESGVSGISQVDMERWTNSWDTDHELPPPEPKT